MKPRLMYVELKTGYNDDGPAWIGLALFSKTGKSVYFNGLCFLKGERHSGGNHLESLSGDAYWISGIKKNGEDRHWAGNGKIKIDKGVVAKYLEIIKEPQLRHDKFEIVELNNNHPIEEFNRIENRKIRK
jgi:hypothetical protein